MPRLIDIRRSITELDEEDGIHLIMAIRNRRLDTENSTSKAVSRKKGINISSMLMGLSQSDAQDLLKKLENL